MQKILILNTGGTFSKEYNSVTGELKVYPCGAILEDIFEKTKLLDNADFENIEFMNTIHKDSLDFTDTDRQELVDIINHYDYNKVIIIHGTDTMDKTAEFLDNAFMSKTIVLTGAMKPYELEPVEATANLFLAYGALTQEMNYGVFIAMHGMIEDHTKLVKNRTVGIFRKVT